MKILPSTWIAGSVLLVLAGLFCWNLDLAEKYDFTRFDGSYTYGATANALERLASRQPPAVGLWACLLGAILLQVLNVLWRVVEEMRAVRAALPLPRNSSFPGPSEPVIIAPGPTISEPLQPPPLPPPAGKTRYPAVARNIALLGLAVASITGVFLVVAVVMAGSHLPRAEEPAKLPARPTAGKHDKTLWFLADALEMGGYVRREAGADEPVNHHSSWDGGSIIDPRVSEIRWGLCRENLPGKDPSIVLGILTTEPQYWRLIVPEAEKFRRQLPAGSLAALERLGEAAEALFAVDSGEKRVLPNMAGLSVVDRGLRENGRVVCLEERQGDYLCRFLIEQPAPDNCQIVYEWLFRPDLSTTIP